MKTLVQNMNCSIPGGVDRGFKLRFSLDSNPPSPPGSESRTLKPFFISDFHELDLRTESRRKAKSLTRSEPSNTASRDGVNASLECCKRT